MANGKNYFTFSELITTHTGLPNYPTAPSHLANLTKLWHYLNYVRERLGQPIYVNSAFRTHQVNEQVRGSKCSYHMEGLAADIRTKSEYMPLLFGILTRDYTNSYLSELIDYQTFFHVAV